MKNLNLILVLFIISCITIQGSHLIGRRLTDPTDPINLKFIKAFNLIFGIDSKWKFDINYEVVSNTPAPITGAVYTASILYKGNQSYASCTVVSNVLLNCVVNEQNQEKADLIQMNNVKNEALIQWQALTDIYNIPINATLNYEDSYSLTYGINTYNWQFRVKLMEKDILPENGVVTIDLVYTSSDKILANCVHRSHYLNCEFNLQRPQSYLFKISETKYSGSISWVIADNSKELTIPLASKMSIYMEGYSRELELIDGQWNYIIQARTEEKIYSASTLITINSKIIKKNKETQPIFYFTRCYAVNNNANNAEYKCKVIGENQELTDLVYVSTSIENDISIDWGNVLTADEIISRKAELSLVKLYDFSYTNRDWVFKIDVADDENLPENAIVWVTVKTFSGSTQWYYKVCSFNAHVLSCAGGSDSAASGSSLERLQTQKQKPGIGSVTWKNVKQLHIDIPLNYTFTSFQSAYGGFFTDKWHFMISAKYGDSCPINAKVFIDILQNGIETTASCILLQKNEGTVGKLHCISDYQIQKDDDTIKINPTKKYGSVTWSGGINDNNNVVAGCSPFSSETEIEIVNNDFDGNGMYFSNNQWFFNIIARTQNKNLEEKSYKVDINFNGSPDTAECFLYYSTENTNLRLVCKCIKNGQNKDDIINLAYKVPDGTDSIKWKKTFTSDYPIILNTDLAFKKVDNIQKVNEYWNFKITLKTDANAILPQSSKVVVDILDEPSQAWYIANCTANTKTLLSCVSNARTTAQPKLVYLKSLDSSVTWKNKNRQDYITLESTTDDPDEPEPEPENTIKPEPEPENTIKPQETQKPIIVNTDSVDNKENKKTTDKDNSSNYFGDFRLYLLFILILF